MTTEEFVAKATTVHGGEYTYENVVYVKYNIKINITCKKHGSFMQTPTSHLKGCGCPKCAHELASVTHRRTTEVFIEKAKEVWGDRYDYSRVVYKTRKDPIIIICPKHGKFIQKPYLHLEGSLCPKCGIEKHSESMKKIDQQVFIERSTELHNGKYTYEKVVYIDTSSKVEITCPKHGSFWQRARMHLSGQGCWECSRELVGDKNRGTQEEFIEKSKLTHGDKYDYSLVEYKNSLENVSIICKIHGVFSQAPVQHVRGRGCPKCKNSMGAQLVDDYLTSREIPFICEYKDHECYYQNKLLFDFAVFKDSNCTELLSLIEYDGLQHFKSVGFYGGDEAYEKIQIRDRIKDQYCLTNGIKLIRIPYTEMANIETILDKELQIEG